MTDKPDPLDGAKVESRDDGETYTITHPAGPIVLHIMRHDDCYSPLDPHSGDGLPLLAIYENSYGCADYVGTADPIPYDIEIDCPHCEGTGWVTHGHEQGEPDATPDEDGEVPCAPCAGAGQIKTDIAEWLAVERGAVASLEITVGGRDQAPAVIYLLDEGENGWTDPAGVLNSFADEYRKWEMGDCWGYSVTGPASDHDSCWGFIGSEYVLDEATYWAARGIETVGA